MDQMLINPGQGLSKNNSSDRERLETKSTKLSQGRPKQEPGAAPSVAAGRPDDSGDIVWNVPTVCCR